VKSVTAIVASPISIIMTVPDRTTAGNIKSAVLFMVSREFSKIVVTVAFDIR
jgi:hypothetical protein